MRKNTEAVIRAFEFGRAAHPSESIWTDGDSIYSYQTVLLATLANGKYALNVTRYSNTTTQHQNALRAEFYGRIVATFDNLPRGIKARELVDMALLDSPAGAAR